MKKTPDNSQLNEQRLAKLACRVAYTLNNHQPVRCTIIGDEPLFYMDYAGSFDDELEGSLFADNGAGFDDGFDQIEQGIDALKEKIALLDRLAAHETSVSGESAELVMGLFVEDMHLATAPATAQAEEADIAAFETLLRKSRLLASFLDFGKSFGATLAYSAQITGAHYDRNANIVFVSPALDRADAVLLTTRELRRLWQHRNGALIHPLTFAPDQAVLVNRAQAADLAAMMIRAAWELQLAGEREAWERAEGPVMGDLARAFAREACLDFRALNNGMAAEAVFEAWFLSERCRHEDRKLIQQMLADYGGHVFGEENTSRAVTVDLIAALGAVPFGKNYLAAHAGTILADALFAEVRDRANANFLWFIKFERSFRDAERDLQDDPSVRGSEVLQGHPSKNRTDERIGDHEKTANIIALPFGRGTREHDGKRRAGAAADIIAFRPDSGK